MMTSETIDKKAILLFQIGLSLFLSVRFLQLAFNILETPYINAPVIIGTIIFSFPFWFKTNNKGQWILFIFVFLNAVLWGRFKEEFWFTYKNPYQSILAISIGIMLLRTKLSRWTFLIPVGVVSITILIRILIFHEIPVEGSYFFSMNRNSLALSFIILAMLYGIWEWINLNGNIGILMPVLTLLITTYSQSRAGLFIAIVYFLLVSWYKAFPKLRRIRSANYENKSRKLMIMAIIIGSLLGTLALVVVAILNSRFMKYGFDSNGRMPLYQTYFENLTFTRFLLGYQVELPNGLHSLHNSFLELLADTGAVAFCMFTLIAIAWYKLRKRSMLLSGILLSILLYAQVEHILFMGGIGGFILYPLILYAFEKTTDEREPANISEVHDSRL
jgi:hypothetical protein